MISQNDIHNAVALRLKQQTGLKTYSNEVLEGFSAPCFFCKVNFERFPANYGTDRCFVTVALNYLPPGEKRVRDEKIGNEMLTTLGRIFRGQLTVGDRKLFIHKAEGDFTGENYDITGFGFDLDFFDEADRNETQTLPLLHVDVSNDITFHEEKG